MLHEYESEKNLTVEQVADGYRLASEKAREYAVERATAKASVEKSICKNVTYTIMRSKLNPNDADKFSNIVNEIWMRHTATDASADATAERKPMTDCIVRIHEFANIETAASRIVDGMMVDLFNTHIFFKHFIHFYLNLREKHFYSFSVKKSFKNIKCLKKILFNLFLCIGLAIVCNDDINGKVINMDDCKIVCFFGNVKRCTTQQIDEQCAFDDYAAFDKQRTEFESQKTREIIEQMQADGVQAIFCSGKIDPFCKDEFEGVGIVSVEKVNQSDLQLIVQLTGAFETPLSFIENYKSKHIGHECNVTIDRMSDRDIICIKSKKKV